MRPGTTARAAARRGRRCRTSSPASGEPRHDLRREQLERLENLAPLVDSLGDQEEALVEGDGALCLLDAAGHRVRVADQELRVVLSEGPRPGIPEPEHVL